MAGTIGAYRAPARNFDQRCHESMGDTIRMHRSRELHREKNVDKGEASSQDNR